MGRPKNTAHRRAQIVDALGRLLVQVGYEKATVQAIAAEAGLSSPGLVHYHFPNKQAILMALMGHVGAEIEARLQIPPLPSGVEGLEAALHRLLDLDEGAAALARLWSALGAEAALPGPIQGAYQAALSGLTAQLAALITQALDGAERPPQATPEAVAGALIATIEGAFHLHRAAPDTLPAGQMGALTCQMARGLLVEILP